MKEDLSGEVHIAVARGRIRCDRLRSLADGSDWGARGVALLDGDASEIEIVTADPACPKDGLTYSETSLIGGRSREIWLQGRASGRYVVQAVNPESRAVRAWLGADVFRERKVRIAFYFLPGAQKWSDDLLLAGAQAILNPQANVSLEKIGTWRSARGLPSVPTPFDIDNTTHRAKLSGYGWNSAADLTVYFGLDIAEPGGSRGTTNGITKDNQTYLNSFSRPLSAIGRMTRTLAHEIGHFLTYDRERSHDDRPSDLMYQNATHSPGTNLRRARIRRFVRPGY